jgi:3-hydroxybutyryl-CoA dehydrogenase
MRNDILVFATTDHPLYKTLSDLDFLNHEKIDREKLKYIFDFSLERSEDKKARYNKILKNYSLPFFCDLSTVNGEEFLKEFPNIQGGFAASFYSPNHTIEAFANTDENFLVMESLFTQIHLKLERVKSPGFGFVFPRIVSMIINEAYFALDEYLATENNIDIAMKFGVNYPLGPFEWSRKIGAKSVLYLLEELFTSTQDGRYLPAKGLTEAKERL